MLDDDTKMIHIAMILFWYLLNLEMENLMFRFVCFCLFDVVNGVDDFHVNKKKFLFAIVVVARDLKIEIPGGD